MEAGSKLSGIGRVTDSQRLRAVAGLASLLGLTCGASGEDTIQTARLMLYPIGGNPFDEDCVLRDVTPAEMAAVQPASVVSTLGLEDRRALSRDRVPRISITPGHCGWYAFGGDANAALVHSVTAGGGDSDDKATLLSAHRDVDANCHTGSQSLPDMTLAMTRYVACVKPKDSTVLGFARVVYVHWFFSSSSAVAKRRVEVAAAAARAL
jgi:hypothetical protein